MTSKEANMGQHRFYQTPEHHEEFRYTCLECGKRRTHTWKARAWADLNGEPFVAWYCPACKEEIAHEGAVA